MNDDAICRDCGHSRSEHAESLPAPCNHGRTDPLALNPSQPGYGCECVGFAGPVKPDTYLRCQRCGIPKPPDIPKWVKFCPSCVEQNRLDRL